MYWEEEKALLIADFHVGKSAHFRKSGLGLPHHSHLRDLETLQQLIIRYRPSSIFFLGDLFHSDYNAEIRHWHTQVAQWIDPRKICLITGNHDRWSIDQNPEVRSFDIQDHLEIRGIHLNHEPKKVENKHVLCGHIHPALYMQGQGRQKIKLHCFWQNAHQLILPAFSELNRGTVVDAKRKDSLFACLEDSVIQVL